MWTRSRPRLHKAELGPSHGKLGLSNDESHVALDVRDILSDRTKVGVILGFRLPSVKTKAA